MHEFFDCYFARRTRGIVMDIALYSRVVPREIAGFLGEYITRSAQLFDDSSQRDALAKCIRKIVAQVKTMVTVEIQVGIVDVFVLFTPSYVILGKRNKGFGHSRSQTSCCGCQGKENQKQNN